MVSEYSIRKIVNIYFYNFIIFNFIILTKISLVSLCIYSIFFLFSHD